MPSILSKELSAKILGRDWSFGYNCYEVGHTWNPSCTGAALEISTAAVTNIVPLYAMLYIFSQLAVQRRYDLPANWETLKSIMRSSFFIFFHVYQGSLMGCGLRHSFGRFYYRVLICMPALISSFMSLLIEKPSRRQALAFYMLNLASEMVYRMMVTKGYFRPINKGETLVFALSLAAWYHLIKVDGFNHDPVSAAVKVLIGRSESKSRTKRKTVDSIKDNKKLEYDCAGNSQTIQPASRWSSYLDDIRVHEFLGGKHKCCPHPEISCAHYILGPIPSRFLLGYGIQTLLTLSRKPFMLLRSPSETLLKSMISSGPVRFGLFLSSLVSVGRLTSCLLRRLSNSNEPAWHASVSGFAAGLSMLWAPRSSLSMYVMWKAVEQYYLQAHKSGRVRFFDFIILSIYSVSAATILYTFALEPRFVRPSYMKFIDNLTDHRMHQLNRVVLDVFGTGSSIGYEDYFPDLDPKLMSNQFKELVFNWMIQPYE